MFEVEGTYHGDIQPKAIFIDPSGNIKILDNLLLNFSQCGYTKMLNVPSYKAALSPSQMASYRIRAEFPLNDPIKDDVFSLAISVISAANKRCFEEYYNWNIGRVKMARPNEIHSKSNLDHLVNSDLEKMNFVFGYSDTIVEFLKKMLSENEAERPVPTSLLSFIENFERA